MFNMKVPVFVINGFLESGKTTFILNAILRDPNLARERVLLITCEEGEEEYDGLPNNIDLYTIEEKEELSGDLFMDLNRKYKPTYVIIEYNGLFGMQALYDMRTPGAWMIAQQITVIDALTFGAYFANMKSIFADMLRNSSRVFVNRCTRADDFKFYKDSIKSCAPRTDITYVSDDEGILDIMLEEDLPYDVNADVIEISKDNYLIWYIDALEEQERYSGKTVEYIGTVAKPPEVRDGYFIAGNEVMTCCEDDMQFVGFVCKCEKAEQIKEGAVIKLRGEVHYEFSPEYEMEGPVIYVTKTTTMPGENKAKKKKK